MPWYDTEGKIETIVPGEQSVVFPTAPKGWVVPGEPGIPSTLAPTRYNNFAPRAGLAYSPDFQDGALGKIFGGPGKSSIRAGYGIFYTSTYLPISASPGFSIHNRLPYGEDYNFTFQRELSKATVLTLSYVGTQGHKLISQYDANPGNAALCMQLNQMGATPTCGPYGEQLTYTLPNGQQVFGTRTFLDPAFGAGNTFTANIANSNFNSLEISAERKASDVTFLLAYTFSKALDNASAFGDWVNFSNYSLTRALSSYDVTHNFVASYNWAMPFDKLFSHAPKRLTQGWNMVGISRFSTGFPITMSQSSGDQSLTGDSANDTPDLVGHVKTQNAHSPGPNGPNTYFFPDAFASETYGSFGTANRRFFHGPGILNTDFALEKNTRVTESTAVQFPGGVFQHLQSHTIYEPERQFQQQHSWGRHWGTRPAHRAVELEISL